MIFLKRFALILFFFMIGSIVITSFFFIGNDAVKDYTKGFITEIITDQQSSRLTKAENEEIKEFFQRFEDLDLPHPIIENVEIAYYNVFTDPTINENFAQYISVQYKPITDISFDTDIYFEYISYTEDGNIDEIYFGQIDVRSYDADFNEVEIISIQPVEKQE